MEKIIVQIQGENAPVVSVKDTTEKIYIESEEVRAEVKVIEQGKISVSVQNPASVLVNVSHGITINQTTTINNVVQPLDGFVPISGTLLPNAASTQSIGSNDLPMKAVYTDELHVSSNTLYVDGSPVLSKNDDGAVQVSASDGENVVIKSKGTGKLIIDTESDVEINGVNVRVNGKAIVAYGFGVEIFEIPSNLTTSVSIVLAQAPIDNSERVLLNGLELTKGSSYDYTIRQNVITFMTGVLTSDGHIKVAYNY